VPKLGLELELGCCNDVELVDCAMAEDRKARQTALATKLVFASECRPELEMDEFMCVFLYRKLKN
jgi:hypothetical protein